MKRQILIRTFLIVTIFALLVYIFKDKQDSSLPQILIIQAKPQEWADALKLGFSDGLIEENIEIGKDVVIIARSAVGDPQGLTGLARSAAKQNYKLIFTLGTQASQEAFSAIRNTPIIFGAVTDPVAAGFFDKSLDNPKGQITGSQDLWPYPSQFELIKTLIPTAQKIGILYNSSEVNSQISVGFIKKECNRLNFNLIERTVVDEAGIILALQGLIDQGIDAMFIPADNTAQTASNLIISACDKKNIPVFTGIPGIVENGALGTVGTNYYQLGKVNANQAKRILLGEQANQIAVSIADKGDLYLNLKAAKKLNIEIPENLLSEAIKVYK